MPLAPPRSAFSGFFGLLICLLLVVPAAAQRDSRTKGVLVIEADTIADTETGFTASGSPSINGVISSTGSIIVDGDILSGDGTLSVTGVSVLGEVELFEGEFSINTATGSVPDVSRFTSLLNVGGMDASFQSLDILSNGVSVSGSFSVRGEAIAFDSLTITPEGVTFTDGKLTLGGIEFDAAGGAFTSDGFSIDTVTATVSEVALALNGLTAGGDQPFGLTGGSIAAAGLTAAFDSGQILPNGISIGSAAVTGLPSSANFTVSDLVATTGGVDIGSGEVAIGSFDITLSGGEFSSAGVTIGTAQLVAAAVTVSLNGFVASNEGAEIADGTVELSGMTATLTGFTFRTSPESLLIDEAELNIRNTTDFIIQGLSISPTGHLSATGGSFKAGGVEAALIGPNFQPDHLVIAEADLTAGPDSVKLNQLEVRSNGVTLSRGDVQLFGGRLEFTNGVFTNRGFGVSSGELQVDGVDITVDNFGVGNTGLNLGGGSFTFGGFAVGFESAPVSGGGVEISATLTLPPAFSGAGASVDFTIRNGRLTVQSGTIRVPDFEIPSTPVGLRDILIQFDRETIMGGATADLPMFSISASVTLRDGRFSAFSISGSNLNVAIGDTGAFLQTIGVSGKDLDRVVVCRKTAIPHMVHYPSSGGAGGFLELLGWISQNQGRYPQPIGVVFAANGFGAGYYTIEDVCAIPPVSFAGTVGATAGPTVLSQAFVRANASAKFDSTGNFEVDGTLYALFLRIGSAYFRLQNTGPNKGASFGGDVVWDVIIDGSGNISIDYRLNVSGDADVALKIPSDVPVIGGYKFGDADVGFNNDSIYGSVKVVVRVSFTIRNGSFSIDKKVLRPWEIPYTYDVPMAQLATKADDKALAEQSNATLSVLTNFRSAERWYKDAPGAALVADDKAATDRALTVPAGRDAIIRLHYTLPAANPSTQLIGPDGAVYTVASHPIDPTDDERDVHYRAVPGAREANWILRDVPPAPGGGDPVYTLRILNPETLGDYVVEVLSERDLPTITQVSAVTDGATIRFDWSAFDPDSNATVDVLLSPERGIRSGSFVALGLPEIDGPNTYNHDLATSPIPTGHYFPALRVTDGNTGEQWAWAELPIFVADVAAPLTVTGVFARGTDDGILVSWTPLSDPDLYGYNVLWGDVRSEVGFPHALAAPATERHLLLPDTVPSRQYRINVTALRRSSLTSSEVAERHALLRHAALTYPGRKQISGNAIAFNAARKGIALSAAEHASLAEQAGLVAAGLDAAAVKALSPINPTGAKGLEPLTLYSAGPLGDGTSLLSLYATGNNQPHVTGTPDTTGLVGQPWETILEAVDVEGHTMTAALDIAPAVMTLTVLDSQPGYIRIAVRWVPTSNLTGRVRVGIEITDSEGAIVEERFSLFVGDTPNAESGSIALLSPLPSTGAVAGRLYSEQLLARPGKSSAPLRYRLLQGPAGLTVSDSGQITWQTSAPASVGNHPISIEVYQDGPLAPEPATLRYTLTVRRSNLVGDIDANGFVNSADAAALAAYLSGADSPSKGLTEILDINNDGLIDAADIPALGALLLEVE